MNIYLPKQHPSFYQDLPHTMEDRTPYTYLIGWSEHNMWYYGRRTAKGCKPSEFWVKYFTSSKHVKKFIENHGQPDVIQIRQIFNKVEKCISWEVKFLLRIDAEANPSSLNLRNTGTTLDSTNLVMVKDKEGNSFCVHIRDPRYKSGELKPKGIGVKKNNKSKGLYRFITNDIIELRISKRYEIPNGWRSGRLKPNEETKIKMRKSAPKFHTKEHNDNVSKAFKGKPKSETHKKNLSISSKKAYNELTNDQLEYISKQASERGKSSKWVNKDGVEKFVLNFEEYIGNGWEFGRTTSPNQSNQYLKIIRKKFPNLDEFFLMVDDYVCNLKHSRSEISRITGISYHVLTRYFISSYYPAKQFH